MQPTKGRVMLVTRSFLSLLPIAALAVACNGSNPDESGSSSGADDTPDPKPVPACARPTHGPTSHRGDVTGNEVWKAEDGPHLVDATVDVRGGASLTIEPCTV